ncbi:MAG: hypothetical protein J2P45_09325 [Candidatus Dormibacteraeota bacterium]|nr:hypothetical protein [Candidatus Dormibacteraeota bacterium]
MRWAAAVLGVILVLVGLVWIGQGFGVVKGSVMTGNPMWAWIGIVVAVVGVAVIVLGVRRPARR